MWAWWVSVVWAGPVVLSPWPEGLAVDGELTEWAGPSFSLGAADQVAGASKVAGEDDLSAQVWLSVGPTGVAVAAKVRDDAFVAPSGAVDLGSDHLELWVSLPPAELPPLTWINQFGDQDATDGTICAEQSNPAACEAWRKEQSKRRSKIVRIFTHQYLLSPAGAAEVWVRPGDEPLRPCCAASKVVMKAAPGGWVVEAFIPAENLPATGPGPVSSARVMVDLVDNDAGHGKQESFLSSSAGRKLGDSATFHEVPWALPVGGDPVADAAAGDAGANAIRAPGDPKALWVWANLAEGYQFEPSRPSPERVPIPVTLTPAGAFGEVSLGVGRAGEPWEHFTVPYALYAVRGGAVVGKARLGVTWDIGERPGDNPVPLPIAVATTGSRQRLVFALTGTRNPLGAGACGGCANLNLKVVDVAPDGRLTVSWEGDFGNEMGETPVLAVRFAAGGDELLITGTNGEADTVERRLRWDASAGRWVE